MENNPHFNKGSLLKPMTRIPIMSTSKPTPINELQEMLLRPEEWDEAGWKKAMEETQGWLVNLAQTSERITEAPKVAKMLQEAYEINELGPVPEEGNEKTLAAFIIKNIQITFIETLVVLEQLRKQLPKWEETQKILKSGGEPKESEVGRELAEMMLGCMIARMKLGRTESLTRIGTTLLAQGENAALAAMDKEDKIWKGEL